MILHLIIIGTLVWNLQPGSTMSVQEFFPDINGNLTKVTWAHATNNKCLLTKALNDKNIMMLEADIVLGKVDGKGEDIPIMGHPPCNSSDLSLDMFLSTVQEFNENGSNRKKGVKLDFKSIDVFEMALDTVRKYKEVSYPVWINADILPGPVNATATPVDPTRFLKSAKTFPNSVLSIGWTTNYQCGLKNVGYTDQQVEEMIRIIKQNNVTQELTLPVRAPLAANSIGEMGKLINVFPNSTLTIWIGVLDTDVNVEQLRNLIKSIGIKKVFIDVPEDLKIRLDLENL